MDRSGDFNHWLRHEFVELNTELEEAYFAARCEILFDRPDLDKLTHAIVRDGGALIARIDAQQIPAQEQARYQLLGSVGFYLGACRRHEVDRPESSNDETLSAAWSLAHRLGMSLGVAPRFVFAHQSLYNLAVRDSFHTFTSLPDERIFITYNGLGVLAYQRAAAALRQISAMGVSNPMAAYLFEGALAALDDVLGFNRRLSAELDVDRFFLNVRPYFKPHLVGGRSYRGANAGDFAVVNEIDLLLGLCTAADPLYQNLLAEKYDYVPPGDQVLLRDAVTRDSLLGDFLREGQSGPVQPQFRSNATLFLAICRAHGAATTFHNHRLVGPFLEVPAKSAPEDRLEDITASGPPLQTVISGLARLGDLRAARDRPGRTSARAGLDRLRDLLAVGH